MHAPEFMRRCGSMDEFNCDKKPTEGSIFGKTIIVDDFYDRLRRALVVGEESKRRLLEGSRAELLLAISAHASACGQPQSQRRRFFEGHGKTPSSCLRAGSSSS
jgi:hypothetical protein